MGKMNQLLHCDWLPERARWSYLAHSGLPAMSHKKNFCESHIINPLLTKLVRSRWLDIGLVLFFCEFMYLNSVSVHKHAKKIGQYPAILTSHLVNNPYIAYQVNLVMSWFVFWQDAAEPKYHRQDQTDLICCGHTLKRLDKFVFLLYIHCN